MGELALVMCEKAARVPGALPSEEPQFAGWLLRSALYLCLNRIRKAKNERVALSRYETVLQEYELANVLEDAPTDVQRELEGFRARLNRPDQLLLERIIGARLRSEELSKELGITKTALRQRKSRLLRELTDISLGRGESSMCSLSSRMGPE